MSVSTCVELLTIVWVVAWAALVFGQSFLRFFLFGVAGLMSSAL